VLTVDIIHINIWNTQQDATNEDKPLNISAINTQQLICSLEVFEHVFKDVRHVQVWNNSFLLYIRETIKTVDNKTIHPLPDISLLLPSPAVSVYLLLSAAPRQQITVMTNCSRRGGGVHGLIGPLAWFLKTGNTLSFIFMFLSEFDFSRVLKFRYEIAL
jgi:hypothetical protein